MHLLFDLIHLQKFNKFFSLRFEHKKGIKPPLPPCQPLEIIYISREKWAKINDLLSLNLFTYLFYHFGLIWF